MASINQAREAIDAAQVEFFAYLPREGETRFTSLNLRTIFHRALKLMLDHHVRLRSRKSQICSLERIYRFILSADIDILLTNPPLAEAILAKPLTLAKKNLPKYCRNRLIAVANQIHHHFYQLHLYRVLPLHRPLTRANLREMVL